MMRQPGLRKHLTRGSVQYQYVSIREIVGDVLCLAAESDSSARIYRAVLEVTSTNYTLRSEEEQESIQEIYRAFLKALEFPLEILIKSQQLDLTPYVQRLTQPASKSAPHAERWQELAEAHARFVQDLVTERTLLEHCFYIILPSEDGTSSRQFVPASLLPGRRAQAHQQRKVATLKQAAQELKLRADLVTQRLTSLGLYCHRLAGEELVRLYERCLTPARALNAPLAHEVIEGIGRPVQVTGNKRVTATTVAPDSPGKVRMQTPATHITTSFERLHSDRQQRADNLPVPDVPHLADILAPNSVEVSRDALRLEDEYVQGIAVTNFPSEVVPGWLTPMLLHHGMLDIVFHIHPQSPSKMLRQLKRRKVEFQSTRRVTLRHGGIEDPELRKAEQDVDTLMTGLAGGEERVFEVSLYLLVRAADRSTLDERTKRVLGLLRSLFLVAHRTTFEHAAAFRSCLPEARNELMRTCTLDSTSLATTFPFISTSLLMQAGTMIGMTPSGEPVLLDEWDDSLDNPHEFCGAVTGAGKSYFYKLKILRELIVHRQRGLQIIVIDPEKEYEPLCHTFGGHYIRLAPGSEQHINPFDLAPQGTDFLVYRQEKGRGDALAQKVQSLHTLFDILLAESSASRVATLSAREKGLLDHAIYETYRKAGITTDPFTHDRSVPLLQDLYDVLKSNRVGRDDYGLADRLERYVHGSLSGLFAAATNVELDNPLVIFDIRDMSGDLRPVGVFLITEYVWTQMLHSQPRPRKLYIDEAWSLVQHPEGGRFLSELSRRARKRYLSLVTITQSPELFASDPFGKIIATNSAIKILKRQDRISADAVASSFLLTSEERQRLLTMSKSQALLFAGSKVVTLDIVASRLEHALATTNPRELAEWREEEQKLLQAQWDFQSEQHPSYTSKPDTGHRSAHSTKPLRY